MAGRHKKITECKKLVGNRTERGILRSTRVKRSGELAQLVERLNGIEEVSGSIPLFSTTFKFSGFMVQSITYKIDV